jgi:hypothetical protein
MIMVEVARLVAAFVVGFTTVYVTFESVGDRVAMIVYLGNLASIWMLWRLSS